MGGSRHRRKTKYRETKRSKTKKGSDKNASKGATGGCPVNDHSKSENGDSEGEDITLSNKENEKNVHLDTAKSDELDKPYLFAKESQNRNRSDEDDLRQSRGATGGNQTKDEDHSTENRDFSEGEDNFVPRNKKEGEVFITAKRIHGNQNCPIYSKGNGRMTQYVQNVNAKTVQFGNNNTIEMVSNTEGGDLYNNTYIGGNESLNIYGGPNAVGNVTIDSKSKNGDEDRHSASGVTKPYTQIIKDVKAANVQINLNSREKSSLKSRPKEKEFKRFAKAVKNFRDGNYIFVTNRIDHGKLTNTVACVPWTAVFDFDASSRRSGLLSRVEDDIEKQRSLNLYTWSEKCSPTEHSTSWIFMNGNDEVPESVIDANITFRDWKVKVKECLSMNISQLEKFKTGCTEFTVIVLWPHESKNHHQKMHYLLSELGDIPDLTVVVLDGGFNTSESETSLNAYLNTDETGGKIWHIQLSFEEACSSIRCIFPMEMRNRADFILPNNNGTTNTDISEKESNFLAEELVVLYTDNKTRESLTGVELRQEEDNFYKGGTLSWSWWYQVGPGHVDIERDIFTQIRDFIRTEHIDVFKSGTITICHNPGSGGTTLAQRILWDLKDKVPCSQLKMNTGSSTENVFERIQLLANKTNLPVILLVDGDEERKVQSLQKITRDRCCLIVIYVKRSSQNIQKETKDVEKENATFWLTGNISRREADVLDLKYARVIRDEYKKMKVNHMLSEINNGKQHSLFEFGLEIHSHNYTGLESYVSGFIQLECKSIKELKPYQRVLAMLSLVYYYGQASVPCHFFSSMIDCPKDHKVLRHEDFPDPVKALVVKDKINGRRNGIRICHVLVAKEVLNQVLTLRATRVFRSRCKSRSISSDAKKNLVPFATEFIRYAGERDNGKSSLIKKFVTRTFISRDNKPLGEDEMHNTRTRRPRLSPILDDVSNCAPYSERFEVMEELTRAFPKESQFIAHLGRLYTICLPEEQEKAKPCFEKALDLCKEQISLSKSDEIPHNMKLTLMHIYHMYGNMFLLWVSQFTGRFLDDKPRKRFTKENFQNIVIDLLRYSNDACCLFDRCREITPSGYEQSCNYMSEIQVRLMMSSFIAKHGASKSFHDFMDTDDVNQRKFLEESSEKLDELFTDCLSTIDPEQMDENIRTCNTWYSGLFKSKRSHESINQRFAGKPENMHTRRLRIAFVKMNYNGRSAGILESISKVDDIDYIVQQYEHNFNDENQILTKRQNDIDYREWLFAIRHTRYSKVRSLQDVLKYVTNWYDRHKTPYARFYLFILKSLIGFGDGKYVTYNQDVLIEAQRLKLEVTELSRFITKPKYPREWLGYANTGIRRLVPGKRFFGLFEYHEEPGKEKMIGTICPPNDKPALGYISLDIGPHNPVQIKVFFVPARSEMKGSSNKNARVEFELGFSMSHGYEAFNVIPLKHMKCQTCECKLEYRSCDLHVDCRPCDKRYTCPKRNGSTHQQRNKESENKSRQ